MTITLKTKINGVIYTALISPEFGYWFVTLRKGRKNILLPDQQRVEWDSMHQAVAWALDQIQAKSGMHHGQDL